METHHDLAETQKIHDTSQDENSASLKQSVNYKTSSNNGDSRNVATADDSISFHLHQGDDTTNNYSHIGETPFLDKLIDPFDSPAANLNQQRTPLLLGKQRSLGSALRGKKASDMFQNIRLKQQQANVIEFETQSQAQGIRIEEGDEDDTPDYSDSFKIATGNKFNDYEDESTQHGTGAETQVLSDTVAEATAVADTQKINDDDADEFRDTQVILSNRYGNDNNNSNEEEEEEDNSVYEVPATQLVRSIEVPSTEEKRSGTSRPDVFDEITSQQTDDGTNTKRTNDGSGENLNFSASNRLEIGSDDEVENTTVQYRQLGLDHDEEEEEEESSSMKYYGGFAEDSMKIYDQLRLKRRQHTELETEKKKPRLARTMTDFDTPSKRSGDTLAWGKTALKPVILSSSPSAAAATNHGTVIPNSSPSIYQLSKRSMQDDEFNVQSSPTTQVINTSPDELAKTQLVDEYDPAVSSPAVGDHTVEIVSSETANIATVEYSPPASPSDMTQPAVSVSAPAPAPTVPQTSSMKDSTLTELGSMSHTDADGVYRNTSDELSAGDILYRSSVWARTGGQFYPTVIKRVLHDGFAIIHRGATVNLQGFGNVFPLDIKVGDRVKLFNRKRIHCVTGLERRDEEGGDENRIKCVRGFDTVYVMPCIRNEIDHTPGVVEEAVPLADIYLVNTIWTKRRFIKELDRVEYHDSLVDDTQHEQQYRAPQQSRGRRGRRDSALLLQLSPHKNAPPMVINSPSSLSTAAQQAAMILPAMHNGGSVSTVASSVFKHYCFAITSSTEQEKTRVRDLIVHHGGKVLDDGLAEIFEPVTGAGKTPLRVSKFYGNYKFAAVLSSRGYCRSAKYLEALALGWPVLSPVFVTDSVAAQRVVPFEPYLLPAGESNLLGTVKSAVVNEFTRKWTSGMSVASQLQNNDFMRGVTVLKLLSPAVGANTRGRLLDFLLKAVGVGEIVSFPDVDELARHYRDNTIVFAKEADPMTQKGMQTVDWEWVVQCIITGKLLDIDTKDEMV